jgi:hypothetical protein
MNVESPDRQTAVKATETEDLEQVIYDRIGWKRMLSRLEWDRILQLKRQHPASFYEGVDQLHSGVRNVVRFLEAVLKKKIPGIAAGQPTELGPIVHCEKCGWTYHEKTGHDCGREHLKPIEQHQQARAQAVSDIANRFIDPRGKGVEGNE